MLPENKASLKFEKHRGQPVNPPLNLHNWHTYIENVKYAGSRLYNLHLSRYYVQEQQLTTQNCQAGKMY